MKPACAVHRSAFALTSSDPFDGGVTVTAGSVDGPRSLQLLPLLPVSWNWLALAVVVTAPPALGTSWTLSLLGEKSGPMGPAPAKIVAPGADLFVFH